MKPNIQLSDIVEASYEGESNKLNSGEGTDRNNNKEQG